MDKEFIKCKDLTDNYDLESINCFEKGITVALSNFSKTQERLFLIALKFNYLYNSKSKMRGNFNFYKKIIEEFTNASFELISIEDNLIQTIKSKLTEGNYVLLPINYKQIFYSDAYLEYDLLGLPIVNGYDSEKKIINILDSVQNIENQTRFTRFNINCELLVKGFKSFSDVYKYSEISIISLKKNENESFKINKIFQLFDKFLQEKDILEIKQIYKIQKAIKEGFKNDNLCLNLKRSLNEKELLYTQLIEILKRNYSKEEMSRIIQIQQEFMSSWIHLINRVIMNYYRKKETKIRKNLEEILEIENSFFKLLAKKEVKNNLKKSNSELTLRNNTNKKVIFNKIRNLLKIEEVDLNLSFLQLGGDSLKILEFISSLNKIGIDLSIKEVYESKKIIDIIKLVGKKEKKSKKFLRRFNKEVSFDSKYPFYFNCIAASIYEKICYENNIRYNKYMIPLATGTPLLGYCSPFELITDPYKYFEIETGYLPFDPFGNLIKISFNYRRIKNEIEAMRYFKDLLDKNKIIPAMVTTYYLKYTEDYLNNEKVMKEYPENIFLHAVLIVDIFEDEFLIFDPPFNIHYYMSKKDFFMAFKGLVEIPVIPYEKVSEKLRGSSVIEVNKNSIESIDFIELEKLVYNNFKKFFYTEEKLIKNRKEYWIGINVIPEILNDLKSNLIKEIPESFIKNIIHELIVSLSVIKDYLTESKIFYAKENKDEIQNLINELMFFEKELNLETSEKDVNKLIDILNMILIVFNRGEK